MWGNTIGNYNTAVGVNTLYHNSGGHGNTAYGFQALDANTTGHENVAIGGNALGQNTTGNQNVALGGQAGSFSMGSNNIAIGYEANVAVALNSNQIRLGNISITNADIQVAWNVTSDARLKNGIKTLPSSLVLLQSLRPVSYHRINDGNPNRIENGFIAQEVETTLIKLGIPTDGIISKDDKGYLSIRYNDFIPVLVKGMQEQQTIIEQQDQKLNDLQKQIDELKKIITIKN